MGKFMLKHTSVLFVALSALCLTRQAHAETVKMTISELLSSGREMTCVAEIADRDTRRLGVFYIQDNQQRIDITVSRTNTPDFSTHIIQNSQWLYTWGDVFDSGRGARVAVSKNGPPNKPANSFGEGLRSFECKNGPVDAGFFVPPPDLKFQDI